MSALTFACERQRRTDAGIRQSADHPATRRALRSGADVHRGFPAGKPHHSDRVRPGRRLDRLRLRRESGAAGQQSHRSVLYETSITGKWPQMLRRRRRCASSVVVLIAVLRHGATALRTRELTDVIGVDRRTVERWRTWWRDSFTTTPFWNVARAAFMPPVDPGRLPAALIERFAGDDADRLVALLRFMGPITGGRMHAR